MYVFSTLGALPDKALYRLPDNKLASGSYVTGQKRSYIRIRFASPWAGIKAVDDDTRSTGQTRFGGAGLRN
jgi:hypothetical protein